MLDRQSIPGAAAFEHAATPAAFVWQRRRQAALAPSTAFVGVCVLAVVAPFERLEPFVRLPWQSVSNLEAISLAVVAAWLLSIVWSHTWPRWQTALTAPWLALLAAMAVSAAVAPVARVNALHMVGRMASAFVVFLVTVNGVTTAARLRRVLLAALLTGVLVGGLTILEYLRVGAVLQWLLAFRPGLSFVGAEVRAGGPLQYATIASMYLEIIFALGLGLLLVALDARRGLAVAVVGLSLLVIAEAITLTFTRTGLVTIAVSLALVGTLRLAQRGFDRGVRLLAILSVLILGLFVTSRSTQAMWLRLTTAGQDRWYRAVVDAPAELTLATGATTTVPIRVTNTGRLNWDSRADPPIYFSYHWLLADADRVVVFDGVRIPFESPVAPQTTRSVAALVRVPRRPGQYRLAWDVVEEGRLWFSTEPGGTLTFSRVVVSGPLQDAAAGLKTTPLPRPAVRPGRLLLWRTAATMFAAHPLFGVGADNFRLLYGAYAGLADADIRTHSNNMYIEVLVGGGLAAGGSLLWLLWRTVRLFADRVRLLAERSSDVLGIAAAGATIFLHGLVDSFLSFTPTNILIAITLGLAVASTCGAETGQDADRI